MILFIVSFVITVLTCVLASEFNSILLFILGVIFALITTIILEYALDKYRGEEDEKQKFNKRIL